MKKNYLFIFLLVSMSSCFDKTRNTVIKGEIPNLPEGVVYLYKDVSSDIIDSAITKNGKFSLNHKWDKDVDGNPLYLGLDHVDEKGVLRAFYYSTDSKFKESNFNSQFFFSDSIINICGDFTDFNPKNIKLTNKFNIVILPKPKGGYQTNAMLNIDGDLFNDNNKNRYEKVLKKIKEYPNSFHLLYQINSNRNSFNAKQVQSFLSLFKGKIIESTTYKTLKKYNDKRYNKKQLTIPLLSDDKGNKIEVLDSKFEKHLVVFWASWCGPCRQEIPALKEMYSKYKNNIEFISISTDKKNDSWQKALEKEQMPWKQLIVNEDSNEYEDVEIFFQINNSIPYIALVDNNMAVVRSHVGLMTEIELENFIKD